MVRDSGRSVRIKLRGEIVAEIRGPLLQLGCDGVGGVECVVCARAQAAEQKHTAHVVDGRDVGARGAGDGDQAAAPGEVPGESVDDAGAYEGQDQRGHVFAPDCFGDGRGAELVHHARGEGFYVGFLLAELRDDQLPPLNVQWVAEVLRPGC